MNKKLTLLATPLVMLVASAATAEVQWGLTPYLGADAQWRHMNFNGGLGDNLFTHDYPQGNLFVGIKFNDHVGVEVGYESTTKKTRTVYLNPGDTSAGIVLNPARQVSGQFSNTAQMTGFHANLIGSFPISEEYRLKAIGMVGVAQLKANLVRQPIVTFVNGIKQPALSPTVTFKKRKSVVRLAGGLEHMLCDHWGIRATVTWENTNKLNINGNPPPSSGQTLIKENNSVAYGLGVFVTF